MKNNNYQSIRRKHFGITTIRAVSRAKRRKSKLFIEASRVAPEKSNVLSLADILEDIVKVENEKYEGFDYNHNPTLGAMYEALTEHIVGRMLPPSLGLNMVGGFIYDDKEFKSGEIDRMLVRGDGRQLGFTGKYEYHIKDVLVVFEVKKTLKKDDMIDAYHQLKGISQSFTDYFHEHLENDENLSITYAARSYSQITGRPAPNRYSDIDSMSKEDAMIFYTLVQDTYAPIKIIHGYGGYKTESGLRDAFLNFLSEQVGKSGFGAPSIPNLITSENYSLAKTTGMPFKVPRFEDGFWPVVCSSRDNVLYLIIEVIWTKISIFFNVEMPWGEEFESDIMINLLMGKFAEDTKTGKSGWQYSSIELKERTIKDIGRIVPWEPVVVSDVVNSVVIQVGLHGHINNKSGYFKELARDSSLSARELTRKLVGTKHFTVDNSGNIEFVWPYLVVASLGSGAYALAHERDKLDHWCRINSYDPMFSTFIKL